MHNNKRKKNNYLFLDNYVLEYTGDFIYFDKKGNIKEVKKSSDYVLNKKINDLYYSEIDKKKKKHILTLCKIIKKKQYSKILHSLDELGYVHDEKNQHELENMCGAIRYLKLFMFFFYNKNILFKVQNKLYYKIINKRKNITKIQKWYRNISFLKKLKNLVDVIKKYKKYTSEIIFIQYFYRKYNKINRKYPCPYSLEEYYEISKEHRIVYRYCKKK